ncbi:hypothetical protein PARPLA_02919 [Rhodobacteraceae bacterium THAF1]|uniref:hypothetical protein n=1 Tax=Palleronia sp. THAF1 TaxID=2587842 RepID=UPI000F3E75ED|nr:hypothetical protein [Palleronia sp. THAF1]QFU08320.1 hypothetical protein FIU81_06505 [Palleronia sp. THAF1]VDC28957.1 hypothetical protein PARPLA_02919 [Rhodobacteraceae bacterium THAF1]
MIEISHKTAAAVVLDAKADVTLNDLPGIVGWLLMQSDVQVHSLGLGVTGETLEYMTDHGRLTLEIRGTEDGTRQIDIACTALVRGNREVGRQLCFQIVRRLIARTKVSSIYWQPTRQRIVPTDFTWADLEAAPKRLAS